MVSIFTSHEGTHGSTPCDGTHCDFELGNDRSITCFQFLDILCHFWWQILWKRNKSICTLSLWMNLKRNDFLWQNSICSRNSGVLLVADLWKMPLLIKRILGGGISGWEVKELHFSATYLSKYLLGGSLYFLVSDYHKLKSIKLLF